MAGGELAFQVAFCLSVWASHDTGIIYKHIDIRYVGPAVDR